MNPWLMKLYEQFLAGNLRGPVPGSFLQTRPPARTAISGAPGPGSFVTPRPPAARRPSAPGVSSTLPVRLSHVAPILGGAPAPSITATPGQFPGIPSNAPGMGMYDILTHPPAPLPNPLAQQSPGYSGMITGIMGAGNTWEG